MDGDLTSAGSVKATGGDIEEVEAYGGVAGTVDAAGDISTITVADNIDSTALIHAGNYINSVTVGWDSKADLTADGSSSSGGYGGYGGLSLTAGRDVDGTITAASVSVDAGGTLTASLDATDGDVTSASARFRKRCEPHGQ